MSNLARSCNNREVWDFPTALTMYAQARELKEDLPDGQWEELKEIGHDYVESYGKKTANWSEYAKQSFAEEVQDCLESW